ncbi:hypothetical protein QZH41_002670 [Actinostola sp. cb2023]|nr:hypothetical protein QZH41_002670 [Actinostola sp. cb2023]
MEQVCVKVTLLQGQDRRSAPIKRSVQPTVIPTKETQKPSFDAGEALAVPVATENPVASAAAIAAAAAAAATAPFLHVDAMIRKLEELQQQLLNTQVCVPLKSSIAGRELSSKSKSVKNSKTQTSLQDSSISSSDSPLQTPLPRKKPPRPTPHSYSKALNYLDLPTREKRVHFDQSEEYDPYMSYSKYAPKQYTGNPGLAKLVEQFGRGRNSRCSKMAARPFQRQHCFLCELPHSPWAVLHDFSEPVCRGCCNYEGAERIEDILQYVRTLRKNWEKGEGNRSKNLKNERLNSTGSSVSSTPSPPPSHIALNNGGPNFAIAADPHKRAVTKFQNSAPRMSEDGGDSTTPNANGPFPKISSPDSANINGLKVAGNRALGNIGGREGERRGSNFPDDPRHSMLNGSAVRNHQGQVMAPHMGQPPVGLEVPRQEYIVHETLNLLNRTVPFDIRFKKDHTLLGRIFAFDICPRIGQELELKILIEYPRGSGCVFQSASRLAKQMHLDSSKEYGRGVSSGFKYIEYEKDRSKGDWRILGELLQEPVRMFKEPIIQELYHADS